MELLLTKRGDGLLMAADSDTAESLRLIGANCIFKVAGFKELGRSALQNAYLWGWLYKNIARELDDCGRTIPCDDGTEIPFTADVLHDWIFADRFRVTGVVMYNGKEKKIYESTAKMSKKRFTEYVSQIKQFSIQYWEIHVPETNRYDGLF